MGKRGVVETFSEFYLSRRLGELLLADRREQEGHVKIRLER
jgi:hypothetical protein